MGLALAATRATHAPTQLSAVAVIEEGDVYNRVVGVSKVHVFAGTWVAHVIDRRIGWIKKSDADKGVTKGLKQPLKGFTREIMWYAPRAGRVVLQGRMTAGMRIYLQGNLQDFMRTANVARTELDVLKLPDAAPAMAASAVAPGSQ